MKYSELISFKPIESTIQLLETADKKVAQDMVQTYVMSDNMAESIKYISMKLDEAERSSQVRLMKVKDMMLEEAHHYQDKERQKAG